MKADRLRGKKEMDFKKPINFREEAPRYMWQGNLSCTQIQEQRVPGLSYGRVCSQKQLGRISSREQFLMYGKKRRAKQNKQRQQKGIISVNSVGCFFFFLNALDQPQEECCGRNICSFGTWQNPWQALWPVRVLMCPRFIFVLPLLRQHWQWPRKRPVPGQDSLPCLQLGLRGQLSLSCVWHGKNHAEGKSKLQLYVLPGLPCSSCTSSHQHCTFTACMAVTGHGVPWWPSG